MSKHHVTLLFMLICFALLFVAGGVVATNMYYADRERIGPIIDSLPHSGPWVVAFSALLVGLVQWRRMANRKDEPEK